MLGLAGVFVAILVPFLWLALDHWVRLIWRRKREECLIGQTVAYFHKPASESNPPPGVNPGLTIRRTADLTDSKAILDGLAPCLPNGDLVVYDAMLYEQTARNISNLFPEFAPTFLKPVIAALPVLQAMNAVTMHAAEDIPRECRNRLPGATPQEVAWAVDNRAGLARRADKPIGFLLTAMPRLFSEAILDPRFSPKQQSARAAPRCERCGGSGFPGAPFASLGEVRELIEAGVQPCTCEASTYWLEMLR